MSEKNNSKQRAGIYFDTSVLREIDYYIPLSNSNSRNEFVRKAVDFYIGSLKANGNIEYLAPAIKKLVGAEVAASEYKISRNLFKIAVELGKLTNMIASENSIDDETMRELHLMCVEEVKKLNGFISCESAARFQRGDE